MHLYSVDLLSHLAGFKTAKRRKRMFSAAKRRKNSKVEDILKILFRIPLLNMFVAQKYSLFTENIHGLIVDIFNTF